MQIQNSILSTVAVVYCITLLQLVNSHEVVASPAASNNNNGNSNNYNVLKDNLSGADNNKKSHGHLHLYNMKFYNDDDDLSLLLPSYDEELPSLSEDYNEGLSSSTEDYDDKTSLSSENDSNDNNYNYNSVRRRVLNKNVAGADNNRKRNGHLYLYNMKFYNDDDETSSSLSEDDDEELSSSTEDYDDYISSLSENVDSENGANDNTYDYVRRRVLKDIPPETDYNNESDSHLYLYNMKFYNDDDEISSSLSQDDDEEILSLSDDEGDDKELPLLSEDDNNDDYDDEYDDDSEYDDDYDNENTSEIFVVNSDKSIEYYYFDDDSEATSWDLKIIQMTVIMMVINHKIDSNSIQKYNRY